MGGTGGREPGRTGGGRGTGDGRRKGGKRDLYDGGKRERNSKRQAFVICYCLHPVKGTNPTTFLDSHLTFSEAWSKILYARRVKKRKFVHGMKKNQHCFLWNRNLSESLTSWDMNEMAWHMYTCVCMIQNGFTFFDRNSSLTFKLSTACSTLNRL